MALSKRAWRPRKRAWRRAMLFCFRFNTKVVYTTHIHRDMSTPTRKPPSWHFTYIDVICLHSYNVCKNSNCTIFEKGIQLLACCIFILWGIILLIRIFSTVKIQNSALIWKHSIFSKGRLSHGSAQLGFSLSFYIKAKNNDVIMSKLKK